VPGASSVWRRTYARRVAILTVMQALTGLDSAVIEDFYALSAAAEPGWCCR
jgi:hypothetical protein